MHMLTDENGNPIGVWDVYDENKRRKNYGKRKLK